MKLYIYEHCPFCVRARMIFGLKALPFDISVMAEGDAATPVSMVGRKVAPILEKDDGTFMPESMDIVRYVDSLTGTPIVDQPADSAIAAWCDAASKPLFQLAIPRFTRADFAELATPEARAAYLQREEKAFGSMETLMADTPRLLQEVAEKLAELEPLITDRQSIDTSDFLLFPWLRSLTIVKDVAFGPAVTAYMNRLSAASQVPLLTWQAI
ncbi:glutaredoxin 2 [Pseudomonas graminis]